MADDSVKTPAGDFRFLGAGEPAPKPTVTPVATDDAPKETFPAEGSSPVEAAIEKAVSRALQGNGAAGVQGDISARLDTIEAKAAERSEEFGFELRNALPGRIRREIHEQLRPMDERLASLERLNREPQSKGSGGRIAAAIIYAVLTGVIVAGIIMFDRPLRYWAQDNLYPLVGVALPVAQRAPVGEKKAPPLGDR